MGIFDLLSNPSPKLSKDKPSFPQDPLGSGRKLQSSLTLNKNLEILESLLNEYRIPKYKHLPHYVTPGWYWNGTKKSPSKVIQFEDSKDEFLLGAFWSEDTGTEFGLFPLGSGDERLSALPIIGHWKQKDPSLTSIGVFPEREIALGIPILSDTFLTEILTVSGFPVTPKNEITVGLKIGEFFLIKSYEFIRSKDPNNVDRFFQNHRYQGGSLVEFCQSVLNDLTEWNPRVLPYIQALPMRLRAILLDWIESGDFVIPDSK